MTVSVSTVGGRATVSVQLLLLTIAAADISKYSRIRCSTAACSSGSSGSSGTGEDPTANASSQEIDLLFDRLVGSEPRPAGDGDPFTKVPR